MASKKKKELSTQAVLKLLEKTSQKVAREQDTQDAKEYAQLQHGWNRDILERAVKYMPDSTNKMVGIGSFWGALELSLEPFFNEVTCVDFESFLPKWKPDHVRFIEANLDSNDWRLPEDEGMFDVAFCIETIEHLLWSPLPLLTWMRTYSHISVISTPDDDEWPLMAIRPWTRYQHFSTIPAASPEVKGNPEPMNHCKQYKQDEFIEMLDFVGFRVLEFFRIGTGKHQMCAIVQPRVPSHSEARS